MAAELKQALTSLPISDGASLAGEYLTTGDARFDVENRLFTNPGSSTFPKGITSIRFERGVGQPPDPPVPIDIIAGLHYYCYRSSGTFHWWEPDAVLARWARVPRPIADDGSCRPMCLAMRRAIAEGRIELPNAELGVDQPFGIRLVVHGTKGGPRSAVAISETFVDGVIAAFHGSAESPALLAAALAPRLPGTTPDEVERLVALEWPGALFMSSPFAAKGSFVQISPCDERCYAGEVTITPDAEGRLVEISGELFTLRRRRGESSRSS
jgi:hypothetical protein